MRIKNSSKEIEEKMEKNRVRNRDEGRSRGGKMTWGNSSKQIRRRK